MTKNIHMCVDIEGVLRWPNSKLGKLFTVEGAPQNGSVVRDWLKLQLAQGKRVLPMGTACEGFSYIDGCPGHPVDGPSGTKAGGLKAG